MGKFILKGGFDNAKAEGWFKTKDENKANDNKDKANEV